MITLRIPCKEPYGYIEVIVHPNSGADTQTPEYAKETYDKFYRMMNDTGNPDSFNEYLIALANSDLTKWGDANHYEGLSAKEKEVCQAFKRFVKRLPKDQEITIK